MGRETLHVDQRRDKRTYQKKSGQRSVTSCWCGKDPNNKLGDRESAKNARTRALFPVPNQWSKFA